MGTAMLVDGHNLFMRAVHASKHAAMSSGGIATGPLVIFANVLARHVREERPDRLLILWDGGTSPARKARLASYKANRTGVHDDEVNDDFKDDAFRLVHEFCALIGVGTLVLRDVEADDLIAGAWRTLTPAEADRIVILSSDKDFMQLLGQNPHTLPTEQVRMGSADTPTDRWTADRFRQEYGYHAWNWPLVTALAGDTGDGVPGLPGIGPKKAVALLEASAWNWATTVDRLTHDAKVAKLLSGEEKREVAEASRDVVDLREIRMAIAVPRWRPTDQRTPQVWQRLIEFLDAYQLRSLKDRLQDGTLWSLTESEQTGGVRAP